MRKITVAALILLTVGFVSTTFAQSWDFYPGGTYNSSITRPQDFLGYDLGERFTFHHQLVAYYKNLAQESDRVQYFDYGKTYEQRPLTYMIITSPQNFSRLETIRQGNLKLADPRTVQNAQEAQNLAQNNPAVAWLGYGVHGNESCSAEAALLTAYQLAAGTDAGTQKLLDDLIIIIDPLLNPDGRDRYVFNYNSLVDKKPSELSIALERNAGRIGRTNHYNFDLNRDWAFQTQIESIGRIKIYRQWMPQVAVDFHEMGANSSYFFFPAADPINEGLPESVKKWGKMYGKGNAAAFDKFGWEYYTHEGFDLLYPGYGDSWPSFMGSIGMTYEQGGGGFASLILKRGEDDYVTLRDRLWHHFTSGIATLKTLSDNKQEALTDFHNFFKTAINNGKSGTMKAIVIPPPANPLTMNIMLKSLLRQGIEVHKATADFKVKKVHGYYDDTVTDRTFKQGSYIIRLDQPAGLMVKVLFEPQQAYPDTSFYDTSAWAYPYATNVKTYWTESTVDARVTRITEEEPLRGGVMFDENGNYAYLLPLNGVESTLAVYELMRKGIKGGIANRAFTLEGRSYKRGTAIFHANRNRKITNLLNEIRAAGEKFGVTFHAAATGMSDEGVDLGSNRIRKLGKPKIGVIGSVGPIRHMFDHRYDIDFVSINASQVANLDIDDINVLIATSNISSSLSTDAQKDKLKAWVRAGGVYVAWGGGVSYAISEKGGLASSVKLTKAPEKDKEEKEKEDEELQRITIEENERRRKQFTSPRYFARVHLDTSHPLAYGMTKEIAVLKAGTRAFDLTKNPAMVGRFAKEPKLSGYVHPDNLKRISDKGYLYHNSMGQGHVVLFSDDPTWREFLSGLEPLFLNAVLLIASQ